MVKWNATKKEMGIIRKIVNRALKLKIAADRMDIEMDITACHSNGCSLNLNKLLKADDFNFMHDISGITGCLNRDTGKLERHFLPRCVK